MNNLNYDVATIREFTSRTIYHTHSMEDVRHSHIALQQAAGLMMQAQSLLQSANHILGEENIKEIIDMIFNDGFDPINHLQEEIEILNTELDRRQER